MTDNSQPVLLWTIASVKPVFSAKAVFMERMNAKANSGHIIGSEGRSDERT